MQYTKPMIDLVLHIRKIAPPPLKATIKLADPDLMDHLAQHYHRLDSPELRSAITALMALAGGTWPTRLQRDPLQVTATEPVKPATLREAKSRMAPTTVMMYRGQKISR